MKAFVLLLSSLCLASAVLRGSQQGSTSDQRTLNDGEQVPDVAKLEERQLPGGPQEAARATLPNKLPDICYFIQQSFQDKVTCVCSSVLVTGLISFNCQGSQFSCTQVPQGEFCTVPTFSGQINFVILQANVQMALTASGINTWLNNTQYGDISLGAFEADVGIAAGPKAITGLKSLVGITDCKASFFQGNTNAVSCSNCHACRTQITNIQGIEVTCDNRPNIPICIPFPIPNIIPKKKKGSLTTSILEFQHAFDFNAIVDKYAADNGLSP